MVVLLPSSYKQYGRIRRDKEKSNKETAYVLETAKYTRHLSLQKDITCGMKEVRTFESGMEKVSMK